MQVANCVWFYMNHFCCDVNNLHLPHIRQKTRFAARISLDKKKDQRGALHSPFFAILYHKSTEWKTYSFYVIFFQPPYT